MMAGFFKPLIDFSMLEDKAFFLLLIGNTNFELTHNSHRTIGIKNCPDDVSTEPQAFSYTLQIIVDEQVCPNDCSDDGTCYENESAYLKIANI